jgi:hypothetical protein
MKHHHNKAVSTMRQFSTENCAIRDRFQKTIEATGEFFVSLDKAASWQDANHELISRIAESFVQKSSDALRPRSEEDQEMARHMANRLLPWRRSEARA